MRRKLIESKEAKKKNVNIGRRTEAKQTRCRKAEKGSGSNGRIEK